MGTPNRPHQTLGMVRSKVDFSNLDPNRSEELLCANYFNKSVQQLLEQAKKQGGDAVMHVRSVVFLMDGNVETYAQPECSDDGAEGQVLTQGVAVRWLKAPTE